MGLLVGLDLSKAVVARGEQLGAGGLEAGDECLGGFASGGSQFSRAARHAQRVGAEKITARIHLGRKIAQPLNAGGLDPPIGILRGKRVADFLHAPHPFFRWRELGEAH